MRMVSELKHMFLYSANRKFYAPIDKSNKLKGACILMLSPDMNISSRLMHLPYMHNPNLFTSFYVDRNVKAYIDSVGIENIELDETEEESISESIFKARDVKIRFSFSDDDPIIYRNPVEDIYSSNMVSRFARILGIDSLNKIIKVKIYGSLSEFKESIPKDIEEQYKNTDNIRSYTYNDTINLICKRIYSPRDMGGSYDIYVLNELIFCMMSSYNPAIQFYYAKAIASFLSGQIKWIDDKKNDSRMELEKWHKLAKTISRAMNSNPDNMSVLREYIKTADKMVFGFYAVKGMSKLVSDAIVTEELTYSERQRLLPSEFGLPEKRKYPMPDAEHVRLAVKMFNNCDADEEKELAEAIIRKMKKFGVDVKPSASNRFKKYYDKEFGKNDKKDNKTKSKNESAAIYNTKEDEAYNDVLSVCNNLTKEEFDRISFEDTYKNSKYVIKRIIHKEDGVPAGFLDLYLFPSSPEIAQIVIAVGKDYRGKGIADSLVDELLSSGIEDKYDFEVFYWTAHTNNEASQNLALKHGFVDTKRIDKFGRKIFLHPTKGNEYTNTATIIDDYADDESILEANSNASKYDKKLKRFLYRERLKNNKDILDLYNKMKTIDPSIKRTSINLKMYRSFNVFIDLSYYHGIFLKNITARNDKTINFYFDFITRLLNNNEAFSIYKTRTVFIPIDSDVWDVKPGTDIFDFRQNMNPISAIFRILRTNPSLLKQAFGDKTIIFVGERGYFYVDFNKFDLKNLPKFKTNLSKLRSRTEIIEDDEETDTLDSDTELVSDSSPKEINKSNSTPDAITADIIDKIERSKPSIKIDNIESNPAVTDTNTTKNMAATARARTLSSHNHLSISNTPISFKNTDSSGTVIIWLDPRCTDIMDNGDKNALKTIKNLNTFYTN